MTHGISFALAIEDHIRRGESHLITPLLASLPSREVAQELLRQGFVAKGQLSSFVETALRHRQHQVLRDVLSNPPHGLDLVDFCRCHERQQGNGPVIYKSLHLAAVEFANPDALKFAIELAPKDPALTEMHQSGRGKENIQTLHFMALFTAVGRHDFIEYLDNMADCARILRDHGAPLRNVSPHRSEKTSASDAFFSDPWPEVSKLQTATLLGEYVGRGLVDVNEPTRYKMTRSAVEYIPEDRAVVPLATAIRNGCVPAAMVLIELGCDVARVLPEAHPEISDIFDYVESCTHEPEVEQGLRAAIAHSLMHVRMRQHIAQTPSSPAPAPRRAQRQL